MRGCGDVVRWWCDVVLLCDGYANRDNACMVKVTAMGMSVNIMSI